MGKNIHEPGQKLPIRNDICEVSSPSEVVMHPDICPSGLAVLQQS